MVAQSLNVKLLWHQRVQVLEEFCEPLLLAVQPWPPTLLSLELTTTQH